MICKKCLLGVAVLILLAFSAQAFAQSASGSFQGTVKDPSNAVVPGANVTVKNTDTNVEMKYTTNNTGTFVAAGLLPGYYEITVEKEGFSKNVSKSVQLGNGIHKVDVKLETGRISDVVEINIKAENIILENGSSVGMVIPEDTIAKLPMVNSNVLDLVKVMGGVIMSENPIFGADDTTLAGLSAANVNVQKDGVTANNVRWVTGMNTPVNLNPEMVSEFKVIITPVDAEMGRGSGQIQVVTRSGGNAYRGSVVWNIQNSALDSRSWSDNKNNTKATWRNQNEWVAQGSGPIIKNKTFIFALFDYTRSMTKGEVNPQMPSKCAKKGIYRYFDGYSNGNFLQTAPDIIVADPNNPNVKPSTRGQAPFSIRTVNGDGSPRTDIPVAPFMPATGSNYAQLRAFNVFGGVLPAGWDPAVDTDCSEISVVTDKNDMYYNFPSNMTFPSYTGTSAGSVYDKYRERDTTGYVGRFMDLLEEPNNYRVGDGLNWGGYGWTIRKKGSDNVYGIGETPIRKQLNFRVDHNFSSRHRASVSYTWEKNQGDDATPTLPSGYGGTVNRTPQTLSATLTSTLKPSLLNELRVGFMRTSSWVNGPMQQPETGAELRQLIYDLLPTKDWPGLQGAKIDIPVLVSLGPKFPVGDSAMYHPYGSGRGNMGLDWGSTDPRWTFADTITWQFGRHSWRMGGEMQRTKSDLRESGNRNQMVFGAPIASVYPVVSGGSASGATITGWDPTTQCEGTMFWGQCYYVPPLGGNWIPITMSTAYSFLGQVGNSDSHNLQGAEDMLNLFSGSVNQLQQYFFINSPYQTRYNNIKDGETYKQTIFYQNQINWFAQDNWRVTDDLTLNLGMRWEWYGVPYLGRGMTAGFKGGALSAFGVSGRGFNSWLAPLWDPFSGAPKEDAYKNCLGAGGVTVECEPTTLTFIGPDSPNPDQNFYNDDFNNFGPVAGFAYTLPWGGKGKTVLRGGIQINFMTFGRADNAIAYMPGLQQEYSFTKPGGSYWDLSDVKEYIPLELPSTIKPPTDGKLATPIDQRRMSLTAYDPNIRTPYTQSLNLRLTRTIGSSLTVDLIYAGNLSRKSSTSINLNTPNMISNGMFEALKIARAGGESPLLDKLFGNINIMGIVKPPNDPMPSGAEQLRRSNGQRANLANGAFTSIVNWLATANVDTAYNQALPSAPTDTKGQILRINGFPENFIWANPQYNAVSWNGNFNKSNYHSMQAQISLRPTHGLMLSGTYTWSKTMGYNGISDYRNRDLDFGVTGGRAHALSSYGTFDLPFGPNRWLLSSVSPSVLGRIIGGWQMSWIVSMQSGAKRSLTGSNYLWGGNQVNIVNPFDFDSGYVDWKPGATTGDYFGALYTSVLDPQCTEGTLVTPNLRPVCTLRAVVSRADQKKWLFVNAIPGERPNMGGFNFSAPMQWSTDGALSKSVRVTEGKSFQIRIDATNIFNHTQPASYSLTMTNTRLGQIDSKSGNRKFQARLRFDF